MLKNLMNKKKGKGFTLIELIIVIAIIAILSALIIPKLGTIKESANVKTDISNAKIIHSAAAVFDEENTNNTLKTDYQKVTAITNGATTNAVTLDTSLQSLPTAKAKAYKGKDFFVMKDADGNIHVAVEQGAATTTSPASYTEVYPNGKDPYVNN